MTQITAYAELLRELGFRPQRTPSGNLSFHTFTAYDCGQIARYLQAGPQGAPR
jgi:hypothetical protein